MTSKLQDLSWIKLSSNGWQEEEGKVETQKFEYLENRKSFLDEKKNMFHIFWRAIIWWRIKISLKIADTTFNECSLVQLKKKLGYGTK